MSQKENFDYVAKYIDTDSFMDLMINQIWIANSDYANLEYYQILAGWKVEADILRLLLDF